MGSNYDPTDLPAQQQDKRELDARKRLVRETEISDLKWVMSSPRGRRFMWRLLVLAKPFQTSFDPVAMKMAFNEGYRQMGVLLMVELKNLCPKLYAVMEEEQQDDSRDGNGNHSK